MAVCAAALIAPAPAGAASFSNATPITIPAQAQATPYPSTIQVSGLGPTVEDVNASLLGFSHPYPADVDILLQGPSGQSVFLMSDAPNADLVCGADAVGLTLTFDDSAAGLIPATTALTSGTYKPTNYDNVGGGCLPSADQTPPATAAALSVFNGTNPNGTWRLYVYHETQGGTNGGSITGGWNLDIAPTNDITLGKVTKKKNRGIALITVDVPGPGTLSLGGTGIKAQRTSGGATASKAVSEAGSVTLRVRAKGAKKAKLQNRGKVKVTAKVAFTPTGGTADTETKTIKLIDN